MSRGLPRSHLIYFSAISYAIGSTLEVHKVLMRTVRDLSGNATSAYASEST